MKKVRILEVKKTDSRGLYGIKFKVLFDGGYYISYRPYYNRESVDELDVLMRIRKFNRVVI